MRSRRSCLEIGAALALATPAWAQAPAPAAPPAGPVAAKPPITAEVDWLGAIHRVADPRRPTPREAEHTVVVKAPARARVGQIVEVQVSVGAPKVHETAAGHAVLWIELVAGGELVGRAEFGPGAAEPTVRFPLRVAGATELRAFARCSRYGVWEGSAQIR